MVDLEFEFEDIVVEVSLQLLVGQVNAKLLKGIGLENFKAEDIEHAD